MLTSLSVNSFHIFQGCACGEAAMNTCGKVCVRIELFSIEVYSTSFLWP